MRGTALENWLRVQAVVWLPVLVVVGTGGLRERPTRIGPMATAIMVGSYAVLVAVLGAGRRASGRAADCATIARFTGAAALLATVDDAMAWPRWAGWVLVVSADLADGWLARRCGGSAEGAVLDMETDQFTVLALALQAVTVGVAAHALLLPALRYLFVAAAWGLRFRADEPKPVRGDNGRGRAVCAAVFVALLAAVAPGVPALAANAVVALAVALLVWSFAADAAHLLRHAHRPERAG